MQEKERGVGIGRGDFGSGLSPTTFRPQQGGRESGMHERGGDDNWGCELLRRLQAEVTGGVRRATRFGRRRRPAIHTPIGTNTNGGQ